ncbi:MAG: elongation factor P [Candidatus Caenarcaniphilales bacterium]|nr:elongation factor P [Candidatus Caenarcaniphilales bacterium]
MVISSNDIRPGVTIKVDNDIWSVVEFLHVKPGKGAAFVRSKLKSLTTGNTMEKTFRAGEKLEDAHIERKEMQYLYKAGEDLALMDNETYDQIELPPTQIGSKVKYLKEGMNVTVTYCEGKILGVEVPNFVELEVTETPPGVKGDTAASNNKPATLETGAVIQVPFFINVGEKIRVDTRNDSYLDRA